MQQRTEKKDNYQKAQRCTGVQTRGHEVMGVSLEKVGFYCWCCVIVQSVSGDEKITTT
jgi:hypothetical protein